MLHKIFHTIIWLLFVAGITLLGLIFISGRAEGKPSNWHLLSMNEMNLEVYKIADLRDGYMPETFNDENAKERWKGGVAVNFNLDLLTYKSWGLYWDNRVHTEGTNYQVRRVGWEWESGLHLGRMFDLYYYHHSQHIMEGKNPDNKFPLENFYGVRVRFYERSRR